MTVGERVGAPVAFVALGSNLGDRDAHLAAAREAIRALPGCTVLAASTIEETAPLRGLDQPRYLNQMLAVACELSSRELLERLQAIEQRAGRVRGERWASRTLDLDIVAVDGASSDDPALTLPHPGLRDRDFWQREMEELRSMLHVHAGLHVREPRA